MQDTYQECYRLVRQHEGGYVNHPKDPGGATKWGVIQRNYDAYRRRKGMRPRNVRNIEEREAAEIYRRQYWDKVDGDELPRGVDYAVFDFAVNSGVSRSVKYLQRLVGAAPDGVMGDVTLARVGEHNPETLVRHLCRDRMAFLKRLRHWSTFGRGWKKRVMGARDGFQTTDKGVIDIGVMMSRRQATDQVEVKPAGGKGRGPLGIIGALLKLLGTLFGGGLREPG